MVTRLERRGGGDFPRAPKRKLHTTMQKITANNITRASLSADEAASLLHLAATAAINGKEAIDTAKGKQASALAVATAGFTTDEAALRAWNFDINGKADEVHTHVDCTGFDEFGNTDLAWMRNGQGAVSKVAQSAYKAAFQSTFFGLDKPNPAVWMMASRAVVMARAIRAEGMTAKIVDGKLVLEGGAGERAEAMREAKSIAALTKLAKGETGSNRDGGHGAGEKSEAGEARVATPAEVLALATRLVEGVAKGEEALSPAALSFARRIAQLVAANPEAFAED